MKGISRFRVCRAQFIVVFNLLKISKKQLKHAFLLFRDPYGFGDVQEVRLRHGELFASIKAFNIDDTRTGSTERF